MREFTKEELEKEIELNKMAYEVIEKIDLFTIDKELKEKIILLAETVMEDTADKIQNNTVANDE